MSRGATCRSCGCRRVRPVFDKEHGLRFYCPDCGRYRGPEVGDRFRAKIDVRDWRFIYGSIDTGRGDERSGAGV